MKHRIFLALILLLIYHSTQAQDSNPWHFISERDIRVTGEKLIRPTKYQTLRLDNKKLTSILQVTPQESFDGKVSPSMLTLPVPDGSMQEFYILESSVMHPDLARKYPEIRSYLGYGVENPAYYLRFDVTPAGFHAIVLGADANSWYIDPYAKEDTEHYISYYKKDFAGESAFTCFAEDIKDAEGILPKESAFTGDCGVLRVYDFAMAATGEYTVYHGGTVPLGLAAVNTLVMRLNSIYERDLHLRLQLVANNDQIIFTDGATDPYSGNYYEDFLLQNQSTCNQIIGSANYDVGHVVHKANENHGAGLVMAACSIFKAWGTSWHVHPINDPFVVDYVAHEVGHQFYGKHTQNTISDCSEYVPTGMEPGSGSTIMAYSGVCAPNIQEQSDDYFHAINLEYMAGYTAGNSCPTIFSTTNLSPTVGGGPDRAFPKSTPFVLSANGSDPNGGALTYCWEQMDNAPVIATPPVNYEPGGPVFRSFPPTADNKRWFPRLPDVLNNVSPMWEVLPAIDRDLKFRVTVRDNFPGGGCTEEDDVVVTIVERAGPFRITSHNSPGLQFCGGASETITWDVADTEADPVNCFNVDILLSTNGGLTFSYVLQSNVPNNGSSTVTFPNVSSTTCRIMVRGRFNDGYLNTFYDVNNENFVICTATIPSAPPIELQWICTGQEACYTFPASQCLSGFMIASFDPKLWVTTDGSQICITDISSSFKRRTTQIYVTPFGSCGMGQTQIWTIFVNDPNHCEPPFRLENSSLAQERADVGTGASQEAVAVTGGGFTLRPNPATDLIRITVASERQAIPTSGGGETSANKIITRTVTVVDLTSRECIRKEMVVFSDGVFDLDVNGLNAGMFFVRIYNPEGKIEQVIPFTKMKN